MSRNTDKTTLFFVIYDLWFHEFEMLKPTLNNLTILDSILTLEFVINYRMFKVLLFDKYWKTWEKQFMKPKNFRNCGWPWRFWHLDFLTNHLIRSLWEIENLEIGNNLNFIFSIHTLQRSPTPILWKKTCIAYFHFQILSNLPLPPPPLYPLHLFGVLFLWLVMWSRNI